MDDVYTEELLITGTFSQWPHTNLPKAKKIFVKFKVKLSQENLSTVAASNQRPKATLILSQCQFLPQMLLTIKKKSLCNQVQRKLRKKVVFHL